NVLAQYLKTFDEVGYVITDVSREYDKHVVDELKKIDATIRLRVLY
ncbi:phosphoserine phosphatase, partial [Candidatus Micrarchaeota archaeon]|nr:phosphoserine phosphatase [Candidatus Micrarchaeota archaeon]